MKGSHGSKNEKKKKGRTEGWLDVLCDELLKKRT